MGERGPMARTIRELLHEIAFNSEYVGECNLWKGHTAAGYGVISIDGEQRYIHRFIYSQQSGNILTTSDVIRHSCDNKRCWKPSHLIKGTHADNVADKVAKGRHMHGTSHYKTGLSEDDIRAIRASTETYNILSARYNISRGGISNIKHRVTWKHVT